MNNKYVQLGIKVLRIIIPALLIYILIRNINWKDALNALSSFPIGMFVIAASLFALANLLFGMRWYYLLKTVGAPDRFWYVLSLVFYSLFFSNFLPTTIGGDLVKVAGIVEPQSTVSKTVQISTIIADRVFSLISKLLLLPLTVWYFRDILSIGGAENMTFSLSFLSPLPRKLKSFFHKYFIAIKPWFQPRHVSIILGVSWMSLLVNGIAFWVIIHSLNSSITFLQVFGVMVLTYFVGLLPISLNGIGVQEGSITYLLVLIGFTPGEGVAAALLLRLMSIMVSLIGGVWLIFGSKEIFKRIKTQQNSSKPG